MRNKTYYRGAPGKKYGIWNTAKKCFQFGISEDTPMLAVARLYQKLGDDARKWRFEPRALPVQMSVVDADKCVCCGDIIPEGRQVCPICEKGGR